MSYFEIKGVIPPMITPFKKNGDVDYDKFIANIDAWNKTGLCGYLVLGSNGETPYLRRDEKIELVKITVSKAGKDRLVMVGSGLESTRETVNLTNTFAKLGAHCALILTPNFYSNQMGDQAQIDYFTEVADKSQIPILIYNVPKFTHINLSAMVVSTLSHHPNIIGMKDSSGNIPQIMSYITAELDSNFNLLAGTVSSWYPSLCIGIKGVISALANCAPNECIKIQEFFVAGKHQESLDLYKKMYPVNLAVTAGFGIPGLKYVCDKMGFSGGYVRKPLNAVTKEQQNTLDRVLFEAGLIQ